MLLNKLIFSGTQTIAHGQVRRRVLFSNVVYLSMAVVYTIFTLLDIDVYLTNPANWAFDQLTVPIMIAICLAGIYLNTKGQHLLGRVLFIVIWPLLMHIIPIIHLNTPSDYYLAYPLGMLFYAVIIQFFFSLRHEKYLFYTFGLLALGLTITSKSFLLYFDADPPLDVNGPVASNYYMLVIILYWLLFNFITFSATKVLDDLINNNESQNDDLSRLNEQIAISNKKLEQKVSERTKKLKDINAALSTYAYFNAHQIKGPFCRIQGLFNLKSMKAIDDVEFHEKVAVSLEELEEALNEMQIKLNALEKPGGQSELD